MVWACAGKTPVTGLARARSRAPSLAAGSLPRCSQASQQVGNHARRRQREHGRRVRVAAQCRVARRQVQAVLRRVFAAQAVGEGGARRRVAGQQAALAARARVQRIARQQVGDQARRHVGVVVQARHHRLQEAALVAAVLRAAARVLRRPPQLALADAGPRQPGQRRGAQIAGALRPAETVLGVRAAPQRGIRHRPGEVGLGVAGIDGQRARRGGRGLFVLAAAVLQFGDARQGAQVVGFDRQAGREGRQGRCVVALAQVFLAGGERALGAGGTGGAVCGQRPVQAQAFAVVAAPGQQVVADLDAQGALVPGEVHVRAQHRQRLAAHALAVEHAAAGGDAQLGVERAQRAAADLQAPARAHDVERPPRRRVDQSADRAEREPLLAPAQRLTGRERGVLEGRRAAVFIGLAGHQPALDLDVLRRRRVGQQVPPQGAIARLRPQPQLLPRLVAQQGPVRVAPGAAAPITAEPLRRRAQHVIGLVRAEGVGAVGRQVTPLRVDRPGVGDAAVLQVMVAGVQHGQVVGGLGRGGHPLVARLVVGGRVLPGRRGGDRRLIAGQADLDPPAGARRQVEGADRAAHAAIRIARQRIVHRRRAARRVADGAEVEFDAARRPRPAQADIAELHHRVAVDEVAPADLVHGAPDLAADARRDPHHQPVVLQPYQLPRAHDALRAAAVEAGVGVDAAELGERAGIAIGVGEEGLLDLGDGRVGGGGARRHHGRDHEQGRQQGGGGEPFEEHEARIRGDRGPPPGEHGHGVLPSASA